MSRAPVASSDGDDARRARRNAQARALCRRACELLNLPIDTAVTALANVLKFYKRRDAIERASEDEARKRAKVSPELVVQAGIYLACKLEESVVRLADVVAATAATLDGEDGTVALDDRADVRLSETDARERAEGEMLAGYAVVGRGAGDEGAEAMNAARDGDAMNAATGALYYAYKDRILVLEQEMLRAMEYELNTAQPHVYMFHIVHVIGGSRELACAASATLLDALFATAEPVGEEEAPTIAAAAVRRASVNLKCEKDLKSANGKMWYEILGFDAAAMDAVEERLREGSGSATWT